jgi:hypothetical protein
MNALLGLNTTTLERTQYSILPAKPKSFAGSVNTRKARNGSRSDLCFGHFTLPCHASEPVNLFLPDDDGPILLDKAFVPMLSLPDTTKETLILVLAFKN